MSAIEKSLREHFGPLWYERSQAELSEQIFQDTLKFGRLLNSADPDERSEADRFFRELAVAVSEVPE